MLHPQARAALKEASARPDYLVPGRSGFDVDRTRAEMRAGAPAGEPVAQVSDVEVGGVPCRLLCPAVDGAPAPVLVYVHGGGWAFGSVAEAEPLCRAVVNRAGWAALAVDYRLAPEHPYPAAIEDTEAVLAALPGERTRLGVDPDRVAVGGDSAGANIATAVALRARVPSPLLQALLYPVVDLAGEAPSRREFATGYALDRAAIAWHADAYVPDAADRARPEVSPLRAESLVGMPPTLLVTAECDPLRDEGEAYAARLSDAGVPVVATRQLGMIHGFADPTGFDAARAVVDQVAGALRRAAG